MTEEIRKLIEEVGDRMVIYCWTFLIDQSRYIGQTKHFRSRTKDHIRGTHKYKNGNKTLLSQAIDSHGLENFQLEILKYCYSQEELNEWEVFYINEFKSLSPNGFNLVIYQGDHLRTEDSVRKSRQARVGTRRNIDTNFYNVSKVKEQYVVQMRIYGKDYTKYFKSGILAAEARDKIALVIYGNDIVLNFPEKKELYLSEDLNLFCRNFTEPLRTPASTYKWVGSCGSKWRAKVPKNGVVPHFKNLLFDTEIEAAEFADKIQYYYFEKPFEKLNFPEKMKNIKHEELDAFFKEEIYVIKRKYTGVFYRPNKKSERNWIATITVNRVPLYIGRYKTEEKAHEVVQTINQEIASSEPDCQKLNALQITKRAKEFIKSKIPIFVF